ncbi:MAG: hypothetical protein RBU30_24290 [Polyangia bacterium]|jgi:hypothetical protein|nr:hypothetical protein [Polyangia bacterium]
MEPIAWHVTMRLERDQVFAPTPEARRAVARVVYWQCRQLPLLGFACVDTHLHLLLATARAESGRVARRIALALGHKLPLASSFDRSRHRPVSSVWHLRSTLEYVLMQGRRHGLEWEAYFEASSLPELLGMRPMGAHIITDVSQHLPRLRRSDVLDWTGWHGLVPVDGPSEWLVEAALRASALPSLFGGGREAFAARRTVAVLLESGQSGQTGQSGQDIPSKVKASLLGVPERTWFRLARGSADPALASAIRMQLGWMALISGSAAGNQAPEARSPSTQAALPVKVPPNK